MRINRVTGYAICWLSSLNHNPADIANELDLTEKQVSNFLEKHNHKNNVKLNVKSAPVTSSDLMIRHTRDKKNNSVSVMTKEASQMNDESRKKFQNHTPIRNANCIHRSKNKR